MPTVYKRYIFGSVSYNRPYLCERSEPSSPFSVPSPTLGLGGNARPRLSGKGGLPIKGLFFFAPILFL